MKCCAVICEYNPFHNGHLYQLNRIRELSGCDRIICIMSGDFVQRAEPAIANKVARAKCALLNGADMVVELPLPYAIGSGEVFAEGATEIIKNLPKVDCLAMGCETDDIGALNTLAQIQYEESEEFKRVLDSLLKQGLSYPHSYAAATEKMGEKHGMSSDMSRIILSTPNNILCLEYLKALKRQNINIKILPIKRKENKIYTGENIEITSSSVIRRRLYGDNFNDIFNSIPHSSFVALEHEFSEHLTRKKTYSGIVMYTLRNMSLNEIKALPEVGEGLEYAIDKAVAHVTDINALIAKIKSKRYTESRIKRICMQAVFRQNESVMSDITQVYSRVLAIKSDFKKYLSVLPDVFYIQTNNDESRPKALKEFTELEKQAITLYSIITHNADYTFPPRLVTL